MEYILLGDVLESPCSLTFGKPEEIREALSINKLGLDPSKIRMEVAEGIGCLPELPDDPSVETSMPFCKGGFQDDVSFSGAVPAWDRLALIMSQRERLPERHQFFKLKMRALRQRDGLSLPSFMKAQFTKRMRSCYVHARNRRLQMMNHKQFQAWLSQVDQLSTAQRKEAGAVLS